MTRTQDEILARIKERKPDDFFGFEVSEYVPFLDYKYAKPFLKPEVTREEWDKDRITDPVFLIKDYMPFAWEKANGCRGISASRSLSHMVAWLWLAGEDELAKATDGDYNHYGKEKLIKICEHYGLDWKQWDDGIRTNNDE